MYLSPVCVASCVASIKFDFDLIGGVSASEENQRHWDSMACRSNVQRVRSVSAKTTHVVNFGFVSVESRKATVLESIRITSVQPVEFLLLQNSVRWPHRFTQWWLLFEALKWWMKNRWNYLQRFVMKLFEIWCKWQNVCCLVGFEKKNW